MEIKINVDETRFKDVIEKELEAFSKEELHEIIRECMAESLRNDEQLKRIFMVKNAGNYYSEEKPSEVMMAAAKSIDLSPAYKEIQEKMIGILKEKPQEVLENVMLRAIIDGFSSEYNFKRNLSEQVEMLIIQRMNNQ